MAHKQHETSKTQLRIILLFNSFSWPRRHIWERAESMLNGPVMTGTALIHSPFLQLTVNRLSRQSSTFRGTPNDVMTGEQRTANKQL
jgi:hypothetical protein